MRLALVNNFFPPRAGGSAHLTEELARRVAASGADVLVITASEGGRASDTEHDGYRVVRVPSRSLPKSRLTMRFDVNFTFSPANLRRVWRALDDFAPDVIHQHGQFFDLTFATSVYAWRRRAPTVLSVHTRLAHTSPLHDAVLTLGDVTLVRSFIELSRPHVVVMDRPMHQYIVQRYHVPEPRLVPIPVGVDPARTLGDGDDVRRALGLGDRPVVLSLGHVIAVRDRLALVEAMPRIIDKRSDVAVVVVGIVYDERFLRRAEELGVDDHLFAIGGVPKEVVPDYLAAAQLEAHDLQGYGLGTASLETMAAGVPVVATVRDDNFLGMQLHSGKELVMVPERDPAALASAIVELLDNQELATRVGLGGRRLVEERFTLDAVTRQHLELYERLAAEGAAPR